MRKFQDNQDGIDLVVLDFIMPKTGGKEVADAIMKIRPHAKILFQSGHPADSMQRKKLSDTAEHCFAQTEFSEGFLTQVHEVFEQITYGCHAEKGRSFPSNFIGLDCGSHGFALTTRAMLKRSCM